jgi:hypothetical protein
MRTQGMRTQGMRTQGMRTQGMRTQGMRTQGMCTQGCTPRECAPREDDKDLLASPNLPSWKEAPSDSVHKRRSRALQAGPASFATKPGSLPPWPSP